MMAMKMLNEFLNDLIIGALVIVTMPVWVPLVAVALVGAVARERWQTRKEEET